MLLGPFSDTSIQVVRPSSERVSVCPAIALMAYEVDGGQGALVLRVRITGLMMRSVHCGGRMRRSVHARR